MSQGCQYIGPEQDPRKAPLVFCGCKTLEGKAYCGEHYWKIYAKGTSVNGRRRERAVDREIEELKRTQELEMENE